MRESIWKGFSIFLRFIVALSYLNYSGDLIHAEPSGLFNILHLTFNLLINVQLNRSSSISLFKPSNSFCIDLTFLSTNTSESDSHTIVT